MGYQFDFGPLYDYSPALARGAGLTVALSALSTVLGSLIGCLLGLLLRMRILGPIFVFVNDCLRAIPLLVLMFFFYYFPYRNVLGLESPSAFWVAVGALSLSQAVFTADLVRAAADGVSRASLDAAAAIGLRRSDIVRFIIMPDVLRQILPSLSAFFVGNVKLSSIAAVIGCEEVVFTARVAVSQTYRSMEAWIVVGLIYISLVVPLGWATRRLERSEWLKRR